MSAAEYVFDNPDFALASRVDDAAAAAGMQILGTPTAGCAGGRRAVVNTGGATMTKSNMRTLAFYLAVGAVVTFVVAHLAPIRG